MFKEKSMKKTNIAIDGPSGSGKSTAARNLAELLGKLPCRCTRLAQGMPAGAGLGHADAITVMRALEGRRGV